MHTASDLAGCTSVRSQCAQHLNQQRAQQQTRNVHSSRPAACTAAGQQRAQQPTLSRSACGSDSQSPAPSFFRAGQDSSAAARRPAHARHHHHRIHHGHCHHHHYHGTLSSRHHTHKDSARVHKGWEVAGAPQAPLKPIAPCKRVHEAARVRLSHGVLASAHRHGPGGQAACGGATSPVRHVWHTWYTAPRASFVSQRNKLHAGGVAQLGACAHTHKHVRTHSL